MNRKRDDVRPVVQRITHTLRQRIIHGQYPPGSILPSERQLADELHVSRMSISRALEQLVRANVVEQRIGAGSRVCSDAARRLPPGTIALAHPLWIRTPPAEPALILQGVIDTLVREQFPYEMVAVAPAEYAGPVEKAVAAATLPSLRRRYGGFLFLEGFASRETLMLHRDGVPTVVANLETDLAVSATWVDHHRIARKAVEILVALGHRRIGLVATVPHRAFYEKTVEGYRAALRQLNIPIDEHLIALCPATSSLDAYAATRQLLDSELRPTAIVAGRDLHAEGICRAATERNLVIGRDLSVIGFDDVSWPQSPSMLTTFQEPCYELGAAAALMLIERMRHERIGIEKREIPAPLLLRRSAGPPPEAAPDVPESVIRLLPA